MVTPSGRPEVLKSVYLNRDPRSKGSVIRIERMLDKQIEGAIAHLVPTFPAKTGHNRAHEIDAEVEVRKF